MIKVVNEGKYSDAEKKKIYNQWKEYCKKNYKKFIPEYGPDGYTDAMYDQWVKVLKKESGDSNAKTESVHKYPDGATVQMYKWSNNSSTWVKAFTVEDVVEIEDQDNFFYLTRRGKDWDEYAKDSLFGDSYKYEVIKESKTMKESLDDDFERYTYMASKDVNDADGYLTEYTMYFDEVDGRYVFVFGDSDLYNPNDGYEEFDWETESRDEAEDWFNNYTGFEEDDF